MEVRDYEVKDRRTRKENEERERAYHKVDVTNFDVNGSVIPFGDFHGFDVFTVIRTRTLISCSFVVIPFDFWYFYC